MLGLTYAVTFVVIILTIIGTLTGLTNITMRHIYINRYEILTFNKAEGLLVFSLCF